MHVVEIFLPLRDETGNAFPREWYEAEKATLVEAFGGLTAFTRAPAEGLWETGDTTVADQIVIFEVMAQTLDRQWWSDYRRHLEAQFRQQTIVIRASHVDML